MMYGSTCMHRAWWTFDWRVPSGVPALDQDKLRDEDERQRRVDGNSVLRPANAPRSSMFTRLWVLTMYLCLWLMHVHLFIYLPSHIDLEITIFDLLRSHLTKPRERINNYRSPREIIVQSFWEIGISSKGTVVSEGAYTCEFRCSYTVAMWVLTVSAYLSISAWLKHICMSYE
jgi:hypothetical protein